MDLIVLAKKYEKTKDELLSALSERKRQVLRGAWRCTCTDNYTVEIIKNRAIQTYCLWCGGKCKN